MIEILPLENCTSLAKPRRIKKYVLVYCTSGKVEMTIDERAFTLSAGDVVTITSGQIHSMTSTA